MDINGQQVRGHPIQLPLGLWLQIRVVVQERKPIYYILPEEIGPYIQEVLPRSGDSKVRFWDFFKELKRAKTPTLIQMEAVECGAASLGYYLGYYKRFVPLEELRLACGVSRDGSNILNVKKAAENYGLNLRVFRRSAEEVKTLKGPFIVFWDYNHFLVVEGVIGEKVFLNDPARGPWSLPFNEFKKHYSELVITAERNEQFKTGGRSASAWPGIIERIRHVKGSLLF